MSFLLDTNICSAHLKRPSGLSHRFVQYGGRLHISSIVLAELHAWAHFKPDPTPIQTAIETFVKHEVHVIPFGEKCAEQFGRLRGVLRRIGVSVQAVDLMIASVALANNLTLVTHNTAHFRNIPGLLLDDWLSP
ncbi:MAG: type II toxin-antitoxin system VapC family toxin [Gemmataceae bacterium]|nr:type II toxin-antitoxin system VapC family toxin [Gemmataceae bacterium]